MSATIAAAKARQNKQAPKSVQPVSLEVDKRTDDMPPEVLQCRSRGQHLWVEMPLTLAAVERMVADRHVKITSNCANKCGASFVEIYDPITWDRVDTVREYTNKDYFVPKKTGRLPKREARKALMSRRFPGLFIHQP